MARVIVCADTGERCGTYGDYLKTEHWKRKRAEYFKAHSSVCAECGQFPVELHHKTYRHIGDEPLRDLVALCRWHHRDAHGRYGAESIPQRAHNRPAIKRQKVRKVVGGRWEHDPYPLVGVNYMPQSPDPAPELRPSTVDPAWLVAALVKARAMSLRRIYVALPIFFERGFIDAAAKHGFERLARSLGGIGKVASCGTVDLQDAEVAEVVAAGLAMAERQTLKSARIGRLAARCLGGNRDIAAHVARFSEALYRSNRRNRRRGA